MPYENLLSEILLKKACSNNFEENLNFSKMLKFSKRQDLAGNGEELKI